MKRYKYLLKNNRVKNLFIILSFILIAYLCIALLINTKHISIIGDMQFHWQRINELYNNILNGELTPNLATKYFSNVGSGVMIIYPYITLIPFALLLSVIKNPMYFFYTFFFLCFLFSMIISYYASYTFNKQRKISYLFAITYSVLSNNLFWQNDVGMQLAIVFLPLALFGFLSFIKYNKWVEMSIGVSLLLLSHVISTLIVLTTFIIWLIFNYKIINKIKMIQLVKASILSILCTSIYWLPAIKLMFMNNLIKPMNMFSTGVNGNSLFLDSISPISYMSDKQFISFTVNIVALLTLFIGIKYFHYFNKINKQIYIVSIVTFLMYSDIFPWSIFSNTFLHLIQSPSRIYIIPQLLLDYLFAVCVIKYFDVRSNNYLKISLVLVSILCFQFFMQSQHIKQNIFSSTQTVINDKSLNNNIMESKIYNSMGRNDYYPAQTNNYNIGNYINNDSDSNINGVNFNNLDNGMIQFNKNKNSNIVIPYLYYNGINYHVKINNKNVRTGHDQNHLLKINNTLDGNGKIKITSDIGIIKYLSLIGFISSIIIYIIIYIKRYFNLDNNLITKIKNK